ncbi:MAG TPA: ATP-binding protein [Candidatus Methylacidiphilales bacterium]|jgi:signal transduction histidine kinase|nr:ATP-binding protein [Candidatus Methylacidiphilales bacterium]
MKQSLHIIHVEDSVEDSNLVKLMLQGAGIECTFLRIETWGQFVQALHDSKCDLILSDCALPHFDGLEALQIARTARPEIPFIFVSGTMGEEMAIDSLQNGATDYVLKERLSRLVPAVRRALSEIESRKTRHILESQLKQARKLETIGTLAGGLAHDFRNLLQIMKLSVELLPMMANEPERVIQIAEQLDKATDRGCEMIRELLVFARKTEIHLLPIDMTAQIKELAQMLQNSLPANLSLSLELEEDLPPIPADASHLDRILTNLIMNARDALPEGGEITVSTDLVRFDHIHASSWQIKDVPYLRVKISDAGTGMDETTQSRIFEPFFTTKLTEKGTGLGLSVVYGLMEAHHGYIDLHSQIGKGTTFSLFFPLLPETNVAPERIQIISPIRLLGQTAHLDAISARDCDMAAF